MNDDNRMLTMFANLHPARAMLGYADFQTDTVWDSAKQVLDICAEFGLAKEHICMIAAAPFNPQFATLMMSKQSDENGFDTVVIESSFADVRRELQSMGVRLIAVPTSNEGFAVEATPQFLGQFAIERPEPASQDSGPIALIA